MTIAPARLALCNAAFMVCLCAAGCANTGMFDPSPEGPGSARTPTGQSLAPKAAMDMIAIGKPFISNPDLLRRMKLGLPLSPFVPETFYSMGSKGYTDYPEAAGLPA